MSRLRKIALRALGAVLAVPLALGALSSGCDEKGGAPPEDTPLGAAREASATCGSKADCSGTAGTVCDNGSCCAPLGATCGASTPCCAGPCVTNPTTGASTCEVCGTEVVNGQITQPTGQNGYNPYKWAYFGNLHQHTALSLDAYGAGDRTQPSQAYLFAKSQSSNVASSCTLCTGTSCSCSGADCGCGSGPCTCASGQSLCTLGGNETCCTACTGSNCSYTENGNDDQCPAGAMLCTVGGAPTCVPLVEVGVGTTDPSPPSAAVATATKPLDFLAITDHSEWFGPMQGCLSSAPNAAAPFTYTTTTSAVTLPASTIPVQSTANFFPNVYPDGWWTLYIPTLAHEVQTVTCTGQSGTSFTGCSGGTSGSLAVGTYVYASSSCAGIEDTDANQQGIAWKDRDLYGDYTCPPDHPCTSQSQSVWQGLVSDAQTAYAACSFTSLVAYEWTALATSGPGTVSNVYAEVASESVGVSLPPPGGEIYVSGPTGFPSSGALIVPTQGADGTTAYSVVNYTGIDTVGHGFTGVTGGSGTLTEGFISPGDVNTGAQNHRNVIFNSANAGDLPSAPYDAYGYPTPPQLWTALDGTDFSGGTICQEAQSTCQAVAIPHNTNWSGGVSLVTWNDTPSGVAQQAKYQVSAEIYQHKGSSECYACAPEGAVCSGSATNNGTCCSGICNIVGNDLGTCAAGTRTSVPLSQSPGSPSVTYQTNDAQDSACSFEYYSENFVYDPQESGNLLTTDQPLNYVRGGLESGISVAAGQGMGTQGNPLKLGIVGATDDHNATPGYTDEWNFLGHVGRYDDTAALRLKGPDPYERSPGAVTGVWAEQNTRDRIFAAIRRRETFATSGPRIQVRFYQTTSPGDCPGSDTNFPEVIVNNGAVPMGGTFGPNDLASGKPTFCIQAIPDQSGQIVPPANTSATSCSASNPCATGYTCCSSPSQPNCEGFPANFPSSQCWGSVGIASAQVIKGHYSNGGIVEDAPSTITLSKGYGTWTDEPAPAGTYDGGYAFYYVRVLQLATYRWSYWDCLAQGNPGASCKSGVCYDGTLKPGVTSCGSASDCEPFCSMNQQIQERAWTSPIWFTPDLGYTVLAGSGPPASGGTNDVPPATQTGATNTQATSAKLGGSFGASSLAGMAKDAAGNLYIADAGNQVIRRVDPNGWITNFAGNGTAGSGPNSTAGNLVPATASSIDGPSGVAVDSVGNVYFSESANNDIRVVDPLGYIWNYVTLQGPPAGISMDGSGDLYVAMYSRDTIVQLGPNTGVVGGKPSPSWNHHWAGLINTPGYGGDSTCNALTSTVQFDNPTGVWADPFGNLYVNDSNNGRIRAIVVKTGCVSSVAWGITSQYGVTADAFGNVFFSDLANDSIDMVSTSAINTIVPLTRQGGGSFPSSTWGAANQLTLDQPGYMWMDGNGAIYVSDQNDGVYEISY